MSDLTTERKPLGFWKLTALVVGNMVGSGIFILPDDLARIGASSFIAWGVTVIGAFLLALVFSRLSQLVPQHGGPYAYTRQGLGNFIGFQTVYNHWIAIWVGNIALAIALIGYLAMFFPILAHQVYGIVVAVLIIWLITFVNTKGVQRAGTIQLVMTILKLLPFVVLMAVGFWYFNPAYIREYFQTTSLSQTHITAAASLTLWAFIGVESATVPYKFVENPQRNIPLATLVGTAIAAIFYITSSTMLMGLLSPQMLGASESPFVTAAEVLFGGWGKWMMIGGAVISCIGCMNGWMLVQGQVTLAAAEDKLFPAIFRVKNKHGVPSLGLIITAVLQSIILLATLDKNIREQFELIILMASLAALIPYLYSSLAAFIILKRQPGGIVKLTDKALFLFATLAAVYAFWSIIVSGEKVVFYGSILVFASALLYGWGYGERGEKEEDEDDDDDAFILKIESSEEEGEGRDVGDVGGAEEVEEWEKEDEDEVEGEKDDGEKNQKIKEKR